MRRPGLHAYFRDSFCLRPQPAEVSGHKASQVCHRAIALADFPNLTTDRNGDSFRLKAAYQSGHIGGDPAIYCLLLLNGWLVQINQGRGIDINVQKAGTYRFPYQLLNRVQFFFRFRAVFAPADLKVVSLDEDRPAEAFPDGGGQDTDGILIRPLAGIAYLGAGNLENKGADAILPGRPEDCPGHLVGDTTDIYRRHGNAAVVPLAGGLIQALNTGRENPLCGR